MFNSMRRFCFSVNREFAWLKERHGPTRSHSRAVYLCPRGWRSRRAAISSSVRMRPDVASASNAALRTQHRGMWSTISWLPMDSSQ